MLQQRNCVIENRNKNRNRNHPPIYVIELHGPRAVHVVGQYPDVPEIAAFGRTLPTKVASFQQTRIELKKLEDAQKKLFTDNAAQADDLHVATLRWRTRLQVDIEAGLDPQDISITETQAGDVVLANALRLIETLDGRDAEVPEAEQARSVLESKYSSAKATWEAVQVGKAAVVNKQRELRALAAEVHQLLIRLRKTVRLVVGPDHPDYQMLRTERIRATAEPLGETEPATEPVSTESERASTVG